MEDQRVLHKSLQTTVKSFRGQRKRIRLTIASGSSTINANDLLQVRLPSNSLVDLSTFGFNGTLAISADHTVQGSHTLIRRCGLTAGGLNLNYQNQFWGQTAHAINMTENSMEFDKSNVLTGQFPLDFAVNADFLEFNYFPASPFTMGVIDTGVLGECQADFVFQSNEAVIPNTGISADGTFSISNVRCYVDVIELEDDSYRQAVSAMLAQGNTYTKAMEIMTVQQQPAQGSNNMNVSTGCLNRVWVVPKVATYANRTPASATDLYSPYLNAVADADSKVYIQIGSESFPQYGFANAFKELASLTRNGAGGASSYNYNKLFATKDTGAIVYNQDAFVTKNAFVAIPVGAYAPEHGKLHGINLESGNSVVRIETADLPASTLLFIMAQHTSLLMAQSGQVVSFKQ